MTIKWKRHNGFIEPMIGGNWVWPLISKPVLRAEKYIVKGGAPDRDTVVGHRLYFNTPPMGYGYYGVDYDINKKQNWVNIGEFDTAEETHAAAEEWLDRHDIDH